MTRAPIRKRKETLNVTISPYLKKKIEVLVETDEFSSASDLATTALTEFLAKHELEQEKMGAVELLVALLQTEDGRKALDAVLSKPRKPCQKESKKQNPEPLFSRELPQDFILE